MAKNMRDLQFMSLLEEDNDQIETDALIDHLKVLASVFIKIMAKMCEFILSSLIYL
jgi:hypothetical protein